MDLQDLDNKKMYISPRRMNSFVSSENQFQNVSARDTAELDAQTSRTLELEAKINTIVDTVVDPTDLTSENAIKPANQPVDVVVGSDTTIEESFAKDLNTLGTGLAKTGTNMLKSLGSNLGISDTISLFDTNNVVGNFLNGDIVDSEGNVISSTNIRNNGVRGINNEADLASKSDVFKEGIIGQIKEDNAAEVDLISSRNGAVQIPRTSYRGANSSVNIIDTDEESGFWASTGAGILNGIANSSPEISSLASGIKSFVSDIKTGKQSANNETISTALRNGETESVELNDSDSANVSEFVNELMSNFESMLSSRPGAYVKYKKSSNSIPLTDESDINTMEGDLYGANDKNFSFYGRNVAQDSTDGADGDTAIPTDDVFIRQPFSSDNKVYKLNKGKTRKNVSKNSEYKDSNQKNIGDVLDPILKTTGEWYDIKRLAEKNEINKRLGFIYIEPWTGIIKDDKDEDASRFVNWSIPFEFNPQIDEGSSKANYNDESIINRINPIKTYINSDTPSISVSTTYLALAPDEGHEEAENKQFGTDLWMYYWTPSRIREMEYKYRSLTLPWLVGNTGIIKPPLVQVILSPMSKKYTVDTTTDENGKKITNTTAVWNTVSSFAELTIGDFLTYPFDQTADNPFGEYLAVTRQLSDDKKSHYFKRYIVTDVTISSISSDGGMYEVPSMFKYTGPVTEGNMADAFSGSQKLTANENNEITPWKKMGFKVSLSLQEVSRNFLDIMPDFKVYYNAWIKQSQAANKIETKQKSKDTNRYWTLLNQSDQAFKDQLETVKQKERNLTTRIASLEKEIEELDNDIKQREKMEILKEFLDKDEGSIRKGWDDFKSFLDTGVSVTIPQGVLPNTSASTKNINVYFRQAINMDSTERIRAEIIYSYLVDKIYNFKSTHTYSDKDVKIIQNLINKNEERNGIFKAVVDYNITMKNKVNENVNPSEPNAARDLLASVYWQTKGIPTLPPIIHKNSLARLELYDQQNAASSPLELISGVETCETDTSSSYFKLTDKTEGLEEKQKKEYFTKLESIFETTFKAYDDKTKKTVEELEQEKKEKEDDLATCKRAQEKMDIILDENSTATMEN